MVKQVVILILAGLLAACSTQQSLYSGKPRFADLSPAIAKHQMFTAAPPVKVKRLQYVSTAYPSGEVYSDYNIYPEITAGKLSEYYTRERPPVHGGVQTPVVNGDGVGYGGIFMLLYRKRGSILNQPQFYTKYAMTSISDVSGHLFPLKLGNELRFHYQAVHTDRLNPNAERGERDAGVMLYKVVQQLPRYHFRDMTLQGPIYKIEVWRTTKANPTLHRQYAYYFSPRLGWYIWAQYFADNKLIANYRMVKFWKR